MIYTTALADSIVVFLRSQGFAGDLHYARRRIVQTSLADLSGTVISVVPWGPAWTLEAAGVGDGLLDVRIVVQKKLDGTVGDSDLADADAAATLAEDIAHALLGTVLQGAECESVKLTPSYAPDKLANLDMFDATIITTWRTYEDAE